MNKISQSLRLIKINIILMRYNLDEMIFASSLFFPFRFIKYFNPWYYLSNKKLTRGQRIRLAIEELGPIFIKAGQVLSTRRDLLPEDIADELAKLQDQVPPFCGEQAKKIIEDSLKQNINDIFSSFDSQALASASIAQVHAVTLIDGRKAVVKVLRPGIKKRIEQDLELFSTLAKFVDRNSRRARHFKPKEIVAEISHTLYDELDLLREGANASQLRRNFEGSTELYIPEIYWHYCRLDVLVMERIEGIPIHNISAIKAAGIDLKKLAERGVEIFFTQVFRDSFFHADMHPGNIFVSTKHLDNPQYIAVDFGIVGSLSTQDQRYLAENMLAFFKRDYQRVAELHISSGWLPPDTRIDQFEGAIRAVCEPIFARPVKEISFGQLLLRLFQTARRFNINIQPQLILLQKTLLNIEGVGAQIYPDLDIWTIAGPYLERWLKKQIGPRAFMRKIRNNLPYWSEKLPEIPELVYGALTEYKYKQEAERFKLQQSVNDNVSHKKSRLRLVTLGLCGGFLLSSLILLYQSAMPYPLIYILGGLGVVMFLIAECVL
ncbi:MAG: ubiquinone biosynthesis regulatory protein kinase UbiB [Gammaproteobacteria bacterium]|nr:ubiquinone biosynthesis regulatory protein kinase UbiB [Gammaproteobacteria bacterium]